MNFKSILFVVMATIMLPLHGKSEATNNPNKGKFNIKKDLLLGHFDCKTDVDDLHTVAAFATLLAHPDYKKINYHAVAGAYGKQEGLYVPGNDLFKLAFKKNWSDAHTDINKALERVKKITIKTLNSGGNVWIAEAGQSDFSALLIKAVKKEFPNINTSKRFNIVQHSNWNEEETTPESLQFVKKNANYIKIEDGNAVGNGTPGFRDPDYKDWRTKLKSKKLLKVWQLAYDLGLKYNGVEGRYNNKAVEAHGLDFSDFAEFCWILGLNELVDADDFFNHFTK